LQEIAFAQAAGFESIQFHGQEHGAGETYFGTQPEVVGAALSAAGLTAVMEIIVRVDADGLSPAGQTPLDVLHANLPAITALGCSCVHWHLAPAQRMTTSQLRTLERSVVPQLAEAAALGVRHGFRFGFEHNEPDIPLFAQPEHCAPVLEQVAELWFVWDLNHTEPEQLAGYLALAGRMSMLHVSDTPLPEVNYHLPLGMGSIDLAAYVGQVVQGGFGGPAILEIGGLPKSGGYGRDTDQALKDSLARIQQVLAELPGR
jgi:sugar phosphate isomerase/epimerase